MTILELHGRITESGELEVQLPAGLPPGDVTVRVEVPNVATDWEHQSWTDEEIQELTARKHKTFKELVDWLDANPPTEPWGGLQDDEDAADYIHRIRHQTSFNLGDE